MDRSLLLTDDDTNQDLAAEVRARRSREDLYYRLAVYPLTIPPLRERSPEDVLDLLHGAIRDLQQRHPGSPATISSRALEALVGYAWPGNVRELRNAVERALLLAREADRLVVEHLPDWILAPTAARADRHGPGLLTLDEVERRHVERTLHLTGGNRTLAAQKLGISSATLHTKIKGSGLQAVGPAEVRAPAAHGAYSTNRETPDRT
ncbi:MAG TPA: helix-turn-helix domain-containing protein [Longimicrobium sp.]|nr:helix-turn-helix domain-containing protein [Longimicrobium sp.]